MVRGILLFGLLILNVFIFSIPTSRELSVSFLDVGQGDAILIQSPTRVQMLIDGGATRSVLREIGAQLSFLDRTIDVVVATHPDQDHIGGLSDVLERYDVSFFFESGAVNETPASKALETRIAQTETPRLLARRGTRLILGGGAYADILFPDHDVSRVESNTASIVMRVVYGDTEFILSGDSPRSIERYLVSEYGNELESDVLKAGHHGSKTSSDSVFVATVSPKYAIISASADNRYGHPHQETLDTLTSVSARIFSTAETGTITFRSNGKALHMER